MASLSERKIYAEVQILSSGWSLLAKVYKSSEPFDGQFWNCQSGQIGVRDELDSSLEGLFPYRSCLNIGANRSGLYLSIFILFRLWHPPLFIPWSDVTVSSEEGFLGRRMKFSFRQVPLVSLHISERVGQEIVKYAEWPMPSAT